MSAQPNYWNTTRLSGADLRDAVQSADKQDAAVLAIFDSRPGHNLSPSQVWRIGCDLGVRWLLTSVRRSMTNLTEARELVKLDDRIDGTYGRKEFVWRRLPPGLRAALEAIHGPHAPLTAAELTAFDSSRAAEMKRAEARRTEGKQGDLWGAK